MPFLPINSSLDDPQWLRTVELENKLRTGSLASARWIKQKARRHQKQKVAHAIFTFSEPSATNYLLHDGLYICKEKLHPRKEKKDPLRCVRCQGWGHLARDCKAIHDTCAQCGHAHRTDACNDNTGKRYCVSCKTNGHSSNDPKCPTYLHKCAELDAKHPENAMPFFPTDEPWTQVSLPPKPPPTPRATQSQAKQNRPPRNTSHQTTLDSTFRPRPQPSHPKGKTRQVQERIDDLTITSSNTTPLGNSSRPQASSSSLPALTQADSPLRPPRNLGSSKND